MKWVRRPVKPVSARRELAILSAAINYWHSKSTLPNVPMVWMPAKSSARDRWLTRGEAALFLAAALGWYRVTWSDVETRAEQHRWECDHTAVNRHLARFILLGLYSGSRKAVILGLQWMLNLSGGWVDLDRGVLYRKPSQEEETKKRRPSARLGRRILAHLRRWQRLDDALRAVAINEGPGEGKGSLSPCRDVARSLGGVGTHRLGHGDRALRPRREGGAPYAEAHPSDLVDAEGYRPLGSLRALGMSVQMLEDVYGHHHPDFQSEAAEA